MSTETLQATSLVPTDFEQPPAGAESNWVWMNGKQFLKVDHAINIRMGSPVLKIWYYGIEYHIAGNLE